MKQMQVRDETWHALMALKLDRRAKSLDAVICDLLNKREEKTCVNKSA